MIDGRLRAALAGVLDCAPDALVVDPVGGGSINRAARVRVGRDQFFLKTNLHPLPRQFAVEAAGLRALRDAGTGLVVPAPLAWSDEDGARYLLTEYLEAGRPTERFAEQLGEGLARLHACTSGRGFGFDEDGYCGRAPQPNGWLASWPEFYARRRLEPQLAFSSARGMASQTATRLEKLIARLTEWIDDAHPPALVHGDLWSGNLHRSADGRPALIDPAVSYAHPEAELGMMALFGGFEPRVWQAYAAHARLAPGWRNRLDLYSLYHVLNHYVLFGGTYEAQADEILRRYVG